MAPELHAPSAAHALLVIMIKDLDVAASLLKEGFHCGRQTVGWRLSVASSLGFPAFFGVRRIRSRDKKPGEGGMGTRLGSVQLSTKIAKDEILYP